MPDDDEAVALTLEEFAAKLDVQDGRVHTFMNPAGVLIGADWNLFDVLECARLHGAVLAGERATAIEHGVAVIMNNGHCVFFRTKQAET